MWFVEVTTPHSNDCAHRTMGLRRGAWLEYDKNLIKELEEKTTGVIRNMCKHNPPSAQPTYKDKKSDLIYKRVFCDFI